MAVAVGRVATIGSAFCMMALAVGCATGPYGGPTAMRMPAGMTCDSVRGELDSLDRRGTRSKIVRANAGKKISAKAKKDVERYNYLLNVYLGARCHADT